MVILVMLLIWRSEEHASELQSRGHLLDLHSFPTRRSSDLDLEVSAETLDVFLEGDWIDWTQSRDFETMEMTSFDGLTLKGYYLEAEKPSNRTVVFAHGYLGHAFDMGLFGEYYYEQLGFNVFTPDLRGHGSSEGDYIGFGWCRCVEQTVEIYV